MELTKETLKDIMQEYELDENTMDDEQLALYQKIKALDLPDRIILFTYAQCASERQLAEYLKTSRTTVRHCLAQIREKLKG